MRKLCLALSLAAAAGLALAGCAKAPEVATLGGKGGGAAGPMSAEEEQAAGAKELAKCLETAGIPVYQYDQEDGQIYVGIETSQAYAMSWGNEWGSTWFPGDSNDDAAIATALAALAPLVETYDKDAANSLKNYDNEIMAAVSSGPVDTPPYLIIGQEDLTEPFAKCLTESGYTEPVWKTDPAEELKSKQNIARATSEWAKCARENGFPEIKDPEPPVADDYMTQPTAVLPADITEDQLRALLAACPNFDPEKWEAYEKAMEDLGAFASEQDWERVNEEFDVTEPAIGFDIPGWDGRGSEQAEETDQATMERVGRLSELLYEAQNQYWEQRETATEAPAAAGG
ncbi:MAG: hypothetical protein LBD70_03070 [Bifidobacteriaceae bacterium]|jgi:hypothetical protein|nr:hypothetical protein [Bifidobacteriaceae bacterium]